MEREVALSAVVVFLLVVILVMCWLHACGRWKQRRADDSEERDLMNRLGAEGDHDQEIGGSRKGLEKAAVEALPTFVYKSNDTYDSQSSSSGPAPGRQIVVGVVVECPVCLSEFQDQERGRLLPYCGHRFHVDCIDTWLLTNGTCPVCRASASVVAEAAALQVTHEAEASPSSSGGNFMGGGGGAARGVQYPTNVLFWGSSSVLVRSSGSNSTARNVTIQIITPPVQPLDAGPSASSSLSPPGPPPSSSRISRLNPLRRLLSRDRISCSSSLSKL